MSHFANKFVHFDPQGLGLEFTVVAGSLVDAENFFCFVRLESLEGFDVIGGVPDGDGAGGLCDSAEFPLALGPFKIDEPPE